VNTGNANGRNPNRERSFFITMLKLPVEAFYATTAIQDLAGLVWLSCFVNYWIIFDEI
jgi:hypothetical protein